MAFASCPPRTPSSTYFSSPVEGVLFSTRTPPMVKGLFSLVVEELRRLNAAFSFSYVYAQQRIVVTPSLPEQQPLFQETVQKILASQAAWYSISVELYGNQCSLRFESLDMPSPLPRAVLQPEQGVIEELQKMSLQ
jgi:hypothetical protein